MRKIIFITLLTLFTFSAFAQTEVPNFDFTLPGIDGNKHSLSDHKDAKAVVVLFIATRCPISNGFNARMVELAAQYQEQGVVFLGINSNKTEDMEEVKKHAKENGFQFVVLKDDKNKVADAYQAKVTPEVFVFDGSLTLKYHGRIDDVAKPEERKSEDLKTALDELLSGKPVSSPTTKAFGCTIKRI